MWVKCNNVTIVSTPAAIRTASALSYVASYQFNSETVSGRLWQTAQHPYIGAYMTFLAVLWPEPHGCGDSYILDLTLFFHLPKTLSCLQLSLH